MISFVSASAKASDGATVLIVDKPEGSAVDDLMLACVTVDATVDGNPAHVITQPVGWTTAFITATSGGALGTATLIQALYYRFVASSEPVNTTWTVDTSLPVAVSVSAYRGVLVANPFDGDAGAESSSNAAASCTLAPFNTFTEDTLLVAFAGTTLNDATFTFPAGFTGRVDQGSAVRQAVADIARGPDETTPAMAVTVSGSGATVGQIVALSKAAVVTEPFQDNYKSKLIRRVPPPFDGRLSGPMGKILSVVGTSDNEIGGLFGSDDFLPDETP